MRLADGPGATRRYVGDNVQRTSMAVETQDFSIITHGKKVCARACMLTFVCVRVRACVRACVCM